MNPHEILRRIDQFNDQITKIEKEKQESFQKLADYKRQIEKDNNFLIGKKAMCIHIDNPKEVECICTGVIALDDYSSIKPLFSRNGKKYIVESYEWMP